MDTPHTDRRHTRRHTPRHPHLALLVAASSVLALSACDDDTTTAPTGPSSTTAPATATTPSWAPTGDSGVADDETTPSAESESTESEFTESELSESDVAGLVFMREEEQLAHDVYVTLGDLWGLRIFENIAASETTHVDAVIDLLDRYGIADPAAGNEPGTFTDPALQDLYDRLIADGSESLEAALRVGALIEELDIDDLQIRSAATDVADIVVVYANLEKGSRNHLRAFVSQLTERGLTYEPTRLDPAIFDAIVSSEMERGRNG